jgi:hypothetical protein
LQKKSIKKVDKKSKMNFKKERKKDFILKQNECFMDEKRRIKKIK